MSEKSAAYQQTLIEAKKDFAAAESRLHALKLQAERLDLRALQLARVINALAIQLGVDAPENVTAFFKARQEPTRRGRPPNKRRHREEVRHMAEETEGTTTENAGEHKAVDQTGGATSEPTADGDAKDAPAASE